MMGTPVPMGRWIAMLVAVGCFREPASDASCREGEAGCPCGASGCDAGLVCADGIDLCIPENCVPGSELCTCNDGVCLTGLKCDGQLCRSPDGTGTSNDDVASSPESGVASDATSVDSTLGTMSTDPDGGSGETISTSGMTASDTGTGGEACRACIIEANGAGGDCENALGACAANTVCTDLAGCIDGCLADENPGCISGCCTMFPDGAPQYSALGSCNATSCSPECAGFELYCGG